MAEIATPEDLDDLDNLLENQKEAVFNVKRMIEQYHEVCEFEEQILLQGLRPPGNSSTRQ